MPVTCLKFTPVGKGCLIGYADLLLEKADLSLEIRGCMLMQKDGRKWLSLPSKEFTNENNEKKYFSILKFQDREVDKKFQEAAIPEIEKWQQNNAHSFRPEETASFKPPESFNAVPF